MKRLKFLFLLHFILISNIIFGQDIHFSQFFHVPSYINPTFNKLKPGLNRVSLNTKNQWTSVNSPYQTALISFENSWRINKNSKNYFSTSLLAYYDVAGDASFTTLQVSPSISYNFGLNRRFNTIVSIGIQPALFQRSLDISKLYFDSQFDGYRFDPNMNSGEVTDRQTAFAPDLGFGFNITHFFSDLAYIRGGYFYKHALKPVVTFKSNFNVLLSTKHTFYTESKLNLQEFTVMPSFYYSTQGAHQEFIIGARTIVNRGFKTGFNEHLYLRNNLLLGIYYRNKDAVILYSGLEFKNFSLGLSYDVNVSKLMPASRARGGVELFLSYTWQKLSHGSSRDIPCPIF